MIHKRVQRGAQRMHVTRAWLTVLVRGAADRERPADVVARDPVSRRVREC